MPGYSPDPMVNLLNVLVAVLVGYMARARFEQWLPARGMMQAVLLTGLAALLYAGALIAILNMWLTLHAGPLTFGLIMGWDRLQAFAWMGAGRRVGRVA